MAVSNSRHSRHRHRHSTSLPLDMDLPAPTTDGITHVGTQSESLLFSCAHQMSTLVKQHSHPPPLGSLPSPVAVPPPPPPHTHLYPFGAHPTVSVAFATANTSLGRPRSFNPYSSNDIRSREPYQLDFSPYPLLEDRLETESKPIASACIRSPAGDASKTAAQQPTAHCREANPHVDHTFLSSADTISMRRWECQSRRRQSRWGTKQEVWH